MLGVPYVRLRVRDTTTPRSSKFFQSPSEWVNRLFYLAILVPKFGFYESIICNKHDFLGSHAKRRASTNTQVLQMSFFAPPVVLSCILEKWHCQE